MFPSITARPSRGMRAYGIAPCALLFFAIAFLILPPGPARAAWPTDPSVNLPVCTAPRHQLNPAIVPDGLGGAIVCWADLRNGVNWAIYAQRVLGTGVVDPAWPANGLALCDDASPASLAPAPRIVADGAGGAIVAWDDRRGGGNSDPYVQHVLSSGVVDPAWPAGGLAVNTSARNQGPDAVVTDGAGGVIVVWGDRPSIPMDSISNVFAQRVLASGAPHPDWPAGGRALCPSVNHQTRPFVVADGAGGAVIVWTESRDGFSSGFAQHVLGSGALDAAWPAEGLALGPATRSRYPWSIAPDGAGGAIVGFGRTDGDYSDAFAQHLLAGGERDPLWPLEGLPLRIAERIGPTTVSPVAAVADGAGGALFVVEDYHAYDIYAQHALAGGAVDPGWPSNALAVCTTTGNQHKSKAIPDGDGGAVAVWHDDHSVESSMFVQRVRAGGMVDPAWPAAGRALCTAAGGQSEEVIASDGVGGVIVAWRDTRNGGINSDIYAQRVMPNGLLGGDLPTATLVSLVSAEVRAGVARLRWQLSLDGAATVTIHRSTATHAWQALGTVTPDGLGYVSYEDAGIVAGERYGYRLGIRTADGAEEFAGEAWVVAPRPGADLAVHVPNPVGGGEVTVSFGAPDSRPVRVSLFDPAGRMVTSRLVAGGSGRRSVGLAQANELAPGVYLVRVELERPIVARVAVMR